MEESPHETYDDCESKMKEAIVSKLGIEVEIERAHRVDRRKKNTNQPRTIVCRIVHWKQEILRKARSLKPVGLHVSEDLAFSTLQKREAQIPKLKAAKEAGRCNNGFGPPADLDPDPRI